MSVKIKRKLRLVKTVPHTKIPGENCSHTLKKLYDVQTEIDRISNADFSLLLSHLSTLSVSTANAFRLYCHEMKETKTYFTRGDE